MRDLDYRGSIFNMLASRKLAIILLILLVLLSILGTIIPQEQLLPFNKVEKWPFDSRFLYGIVEKIGLTRIYNSFLYIAVTCLLAISISFCTLKRTLSFFSEKKNTPRIDPKILKKYRNSTELSLSKGLDEKNFQHIVNIVRKKFRFRKINAESTTSFYAVKGELGFLGSLLFHGCFLVIMIGAVISAWTRFSGTIVLTEGQTFQGHATQYKGLKTKPLLRPQQLDFEIGLLKFKPEYDKVARYISEITIQEQSGQTIHTSIRPFHALAHRGYNFYYKEHGFSPSFILKYKGNKVLFDSFVALKSHTEDDPVKYEDAFEIPGVGLLVHARLYPDAENNDGVIKTKSPLPINPVIDLTINQYGDGIYKGTIKQEQTVSFKDFTLTFNDLHYWSSFRVVRDPGYNIIVIGFFIGFAGLLIRIFFVREAIWMLFSKDEVNPTITIAGFRERDKVFFAERFKKIVAEIQKLQEVYPDYS
jgi:cytochrome c biogenesis protein ResB